MKIINFLVVLLLMVFSISCSKEQTENVEGVETESSENMSIRLEDNMLSFDSEESLASFLDSGNSVKFKNTINNLSSQGFQSLRPVFENLSDPKIDEFLASKAIRIQEKGKLFSSRVNQEEIDLDDEIIADESFASILNENREILVGENYYIYTTNGLYFCNRKKINKLRNYLRKLNTDKSFTPRANKGECDYYKINSDGVMSLSPVQGSITSVTNDINLYTTDCDGGGSTGGGTGGSTGGTTTTTIPLLVPQNFGSCSYTENSLFQQIFGNTVKCNDYHDSTHRIQTKVWNENYLIWSSVGASAKYQKKRFIGWSESSTSDGVRLGINHAIYTYKSPISPYNAHDPKRVIFKYKGVNYDQFGNVVTTYPINSSVWPFPQKETLGAIEITIFGDDQYWPLTGKDANKSINQLLSKARGVIRGLSNDMTQDKVGVQIVKFLPTSFKITQADILLKHSSQAKKTFDFNFLLKFKSNTSGWFQNVTNQLNAEKYDKIDIDMYGAALRNNVWKGKRVSGKVD